MSSSRCAPENTRMLLNRILYCSGEKLSQKYISSNPKTDFAYCPAENTMVIANAESCEQTTVIDTKNY